MKKTFSVTFFLSKFRGRLDFFLLLVNWKQKWLGMNTSLVFLYTKMYVDRNHYIELGTLMQCQLFSMEKQSLLHHVHMVQDIWIIFLILVINCLMHWMPEKHLHFFLFHIVNTILYTKCYDFAMIDWWLWSSNCCLCINMVKERLACTFVSRVTKDCIV